MRLLFFFKQVGCFVASSFHVFVLVFKEPAWNKPSNHDKLTHRASYMQTERYVVPLSHDEAGKTIRTWRTTQHSPIDPKKAA